jgi:hypothetical protein
MRQTMGKATFVVGELLPWKGWWWRVAEVFTDTSGEVVSLTIEPKKLTGSSRRKESSDGDEVE